MCKVGVRCAADTRGACDTSRARYQRAFGDAAPSPSPLAHIEANYAMQAKVAKATPPAPAPAVANEVTTAPVTHAPAGTADNSPAASRARQAAPVNQRPNAGRGRLRDPEVARRAAITLGASGRLAGQGAFGAMSFLNARKAAGQARSLTDPRSSQVALATSSAGARTSASAAHTGRQAFLAAHAASGGGRSLTHPEAGQVAVGTLSAGGRTSAGGAHAARVHLEAVGKMPERSEFALA